MKRASAQALHLSSSFPQDLVLIPSGDIVEEEDEREVGPKKRQGPGGLEDVRLSPDPEMRRPQGYLSVSSDSHTRLPFSCKLWVSI